VVQIQRELNACIAMLDLGGCGSGGKHRDLLFMAFVIDRDPGKVCNSARLDRPAIY